MASQKLLSFLSNVILISLFLSISIPCKALVDSKKLSDLIGVRKPISISQKYTNSCILKGNGASVEYWYILNSKVCPKSTDSAFGKEEKYDKLIKLGYGFRLFTVCTSTGTSINCKNKPNLTPFNYVGRCIMPVKRTNGYSSVFCIQGMSNTEADILLNSLIN
jgi:hypothetical protein